MRISILEKIKKEAIKKYDELKCFTNTDEGLVMIVFTSITINTRKVNDFREEDTDEYIGIYEGEWILYRHDIEHFGGPIKIKNENISTLNSNEVLNYINELSDKEYMRFMRKACKIYPAI